MKLETIHDKSLTMILAIEKKLEDSTIEQDSSVFISESTTFRSHDGLKPDELLGELLIFMGNQTMMPLIIDNSENIQKSHIIIC